MAKSKDRSAIAVHSSAFEDRCFREKEKLQAKLSGQLQSDMGRLFDDGQHSDLTFQLHDSCVRAHHFMLRARCKDFYRILMKKTECLDKVDLVVGHFSGFLRHLYTTENISTLLAEFEDYLDKLSVHHSSIPHSDWIPDLVAYSEHKNLIQNVEIEDRMSKGCLISPTTFQQVGSKGEITDKHSNGLLAGEAIQSVSPQKSIQCQISPSDNDNLPVTETSHSMPLQHEVCSRLGEDLLRAYQQEIHSDCVISVIGKEFKVQSCILSARSEYFASMLNGSWRESEAMTLTLESVSAGVMEQTLLYLYGGVIDRLDTCSFSELIMVADMYGLQGLKEVVNYTIKKELCHFFHKPCAACLSGCVEALGAAVAYNLEEIKERCLRWINKNLSKVWPTKNFSTLPQNILDMCCSETIDSLTVESVIDVMLDCQKIDQSVPRLKWAEPVVILVTRLMDAAVKFTCEHLLQLLSSRKFLNFDQTMALSLDLLENIFRMVFKSLNPDKACEAFLCLDALKQTVHSELTDVAWTEASGPDAAGGIEVSPEECMTLFQVLYYRNTQLGVQVSSKDFQEFVDVLCGQCEEYMKLHIHQAVHSMDWNLLSTDQQTQLLQSASYVCVDNTNRRKVVPPKLTSMGKRTTQSLHSSRKDCKFVKSTIHSAAGIATKVKDRSTKSNQYLQNQTDNVSDKKSKDKPGTALGSNDKTDGLPQDGSSEQLPNSQASCSQTRQASSEEVL